MPETSPRDRAAVARQLGRTPKPFRVARETVGEKRVEETHAEHRALYGTRVAGVRADAAGSVKCLHAFTALHLAGAIPNPIAEWTLEHLEAPFPRDACCT